MLRADTIPTSGIARLPIESNMLYLTGVAWCIHRCNASVGIVRRQFAPKNETPRSEDKMRELVIMMLRQKINTSFHSQPRLPCQSLRFSLQKGQTHLKKIIHRRIKIFHLNIDRLLSHWISFGWSFLWSGPLDNTKFWQPHSTMTLPEFSHCAERVMVLSVDEQSFRSIAVSCFCQLNQRRIRAFLPVAIIFSLYKGVC